MSRPDSGVARSPSLSSPDVHAGEDVGAALHRVPTTLESEADSTPRIPAVIADGTWSWWEARKPGGGRSAGHAGDGGRRAVGWPGSLTWFRDNPSRPCARRAGPSRRLRPAGAAARCCGAARPMFLPRKILARGPLQRRIEVTLRTVVVPPARSADPPGALAGWRPVGNPACMKHGGGRAVIGRLDLEPDAIGRRNHALGAAGVTLSGSGWALATTGERSRSMARRDRGGRLGYPRCSAW